MTHRLWGAQNLCRRSFSRLILRARSQFLTVEYKQKGTHEAVKMKPYALALLMLTSIAGAEPFVDATTAHARKDYATAFMIFQSLATQGIAQAQFNLGLMYAQGQGVVQDDEEAVKWYKLAGAQGQVSALHNLCVMYANGRGVVQDYAVAGKWFKLAARQGQVSAQFILALMYQAGQGMEQDYAEAARWFRLAATQGHTPAQVILGLMYLQGQGVIQDYVLAHMWFSLASMKGDRDAVQGRDIAARNMTSQQIGAAQKLARDCPARNFIRCN